MEKADPQKQQRVGMGSSVLRKPFSDLTNLIPEPHHHSSSFSQSKKPTTSGDPDMSISIIGSTQIHSLVQHRFTALRDQHPLPTPPTPSPVTLNLAHSHKRRCDLVGDGKRIAYNGPLTMMKTRSKTKATAMLVYPIHLEKTKNKTKGIPIPDSTNRNDLSKKYEGTMVATPVNYEVNGAEDLLKSKSAKVALPTNKKRNRSKKFVFPQDFIDQQRAYFKEIDEYELEVEEVDEVSI